MEILIPEESIPESKLPTLCPHNQVTELCSCLRYISVFPLESFCHDDEDKAYIFNGYPVVDFPFNMYRPILPNGYKPTLFFPNWFADITQEIDCMSSHGQVFSATDTRTLEDVEIFQSTPLDFRNEERIILMSELMALLYIIYVEIPRKESKVSLYHRKPSHCKGFEIYVVYPLIRSESEDHTQISDVIASLMRHKFRCNLRRYHHLNLEDELQPEIEMYQKLLVEMKTLVNEPLTKENMCDSWYQDLKECVNYLSTKSSRIVKKMRQTVREAGFLILQKALLYNEINHPIHAGSLQRISLLNIASQARDVKYTESLRDITPPVLYKDILLPMINRVSHPG